MNFDWKSMSTEEALAQWYRNEPVMSVSMSGIGPSHEQVVQMLGFEMLQAMLEKPVDWDGSTEEQLNEYYDKIRTDPRVRILDAHLESSGMQVGAALSLACMFARQGYGKALGMLEDPRRMIMVSRIFPALPEPPGLLEALS